MIGAWDRQGFLALIGKLAKARGPSLDEGLRREVLEGFFHDAGVPFETDRAGNLLVKLGAGPMEDTVVFDAHMDVVQEGFTDSARYDHDVMKGLGLADNLTAVTLLGLFSVVIHHKYAHAMKRPLTVLFSTGEEGHGNLNGVKQFIDDFKGSPYVFLAFDLGFDTYSISGLGSIRYELNVRCPGGHSWDDYGTPGAIKVMMDFLASVSRLFEEQSAKYPGSLSFNIGSVRGGEGINSIARNATAGFEFRSAFPEPLEALDREVSNISECMGKMKDVELSCFITGKRPAARPVNPNRIEPLVKAILSGVGEVTAERIRSTNINATLAEGWPSLCMGLCTCGRFHTHEEYVVLDSVEKGWAVLSELAKRLLFATP